MTPETRATHRRNPIQAETVGSLGTAEGATYSVWDRGHLSWTVKADSHFRKTGENSREALFNVPGGKGTAMRKRMETQRGP